MDGQSFDALTRRLTRATSRRTALAALGGAIAAGLTASVTQAAKGNKVGICHWDNATATWSLISVAAKSVPAHQAHGDTISPDFATNTAHCGSCGNACDAGDTCVDGACLRPVPLIDLGGFCTIEGSREECAQLDVFDGPAPVVCAYSEFWRDLVCLGETGMTCGDADPGTTDFPQLCVSGACSTDGSAPAKCA